MEEKNHVSAAVVPYIVYESSMARSERHIRRLLWTLLVVVILLAATNLAWMYMWSGYDYEDESVTVKSGDGIANYIGDRGDITNGIDYCQETEMDP